MFGEKKKKKSRLSALGHLLVEQIYSQKCFLGCFAFMSQLPVFAWQASCVPLSLLVLSLTLSCHRFIMCLWSPALCQPSTSLFMYTMLSRMPASFMFCFEFTTRGFCLHRPVPIFWSRLHPVSSSVSYLMSEPVLSSALDDLLYPYAPLYLCEFLFVVNVHFWALVFLVCSCSCGFGPLRYPGFLLSTCALTLATDL